MIYRHKTEEYGDLTYSDGIRYRYLESSFQFVYGTLFADVFSGESAIELTKRDGIQAGFKLTTIQTFSCINGLVAHKDSVSLCFLTTCSVSCSRAFSAV